MRADFKEIFRSWIEGLQIWWFKRRAMRVEHYIIHKRKTEWIFSGVRQDEKGYFSDIGFVRSPYHMNRAQALKFFVRNYVRATIKNIDDRNKIITYTIS